MPLSPAARLRFGLVVVVFETFLSQRVLIVNVPDLSFVLVSCLVHLLNMCMLFASTSRSHFFIVFLYFGDRRSGGRTLPLSFSFICEQSIYKRRSLKMNVNKNHKF